MQHVDLEDDIYTDCSSWLMIETDECCQWSFHWILVIGIYDLVVRPSSLRLTGDACFILINWLGVCYIGE